MNARDIHHRETTELSEKPRLGKILTGKVPDWKKPSANDCYVGENFEISVRRASGDRFTAKDPIGFGGGLNFYAYALNNPINFIDPLGLAIGDFPPAPPGYNPDTWQVGQWDNGRWHVTDPEGKTWTAHPEDEGEWRHWDTQDANGKKGAWPSNKRKPWRGQKKPAKSPQCDSDPSGDAPPWEPPIPLGENNQNNYGMPYTPLPEWWTPVPEVFPALEPVPIM